MRRTGLLLSLVALIGGCVDIPDPHKREPLRQSAAVVTPRPEARQCLSRLGATRADFTILPDRYFGNGCSNLNSVSLASLQGDSANFMVSNLGPVSCPVATGFAGWARFGVDRAARVMLGTAVVRIETMGSYSCRNVAGTARRSAHATADAIDISAFVLADGRRLSVREGWWNGSAAERTFLRRVHESACKRFGTVLGPDYNAAHHDHFHLEMAAGGRGICR